MEQWSAYLNEFWFWVAPSLQYLFIGYFVALSLAYLILNVLSFRAIRNYMEQYSSPILPKSFGPLLPPVSLLVPAYNEETTIVTSIKSLLQLEYPTFEIIIVDDGSKDNTTAALAEAFALVPTSSNHQQVLDTKDIEQVFRSATYQNIRVVRKKNGGKADALNVGINLSKYPLFCAVDADSILQRDSLDRIVKTFVDNPHTVAAGGSIRVANGSRVFNGLMKTPGLSDKFIARLQTIEYMRAFLFGRMGWSPLNAMLIISGAFGVFRKSTVLQCKGYSPDTIGEDMELILKLHRHCSLRGKPYHITFVPDPVCWTEVPEDLKTLKNQRIRWQRGLWESLWANKSYLFAKNSGLAGHLAYPFMLFFDAVGPLIEMTAYIMSVLFFISGAIDISLFLSFIVVAFVFGVFISVLALLLEELSFHTYRSPLASFRLLLAAIAENFGYRQLNSWWRLVGTIRWIRGKKHDWGEMKRTGKWQSN